MTKGLQATILAVVGLLLSAVGALPVIFSSGYRGWIADHWTYYYPALQLWALVAMCVLLVLILLAVVLRCRAMQGAAPSDQGPPVLHPTVPQPIRRVDQGLLDEFETLLASTSDALILLQQWDFANPFDLADLGPLQAFDHEWNNPEHEFVDAEVQAALDSFRRAVGEFLHEMSIRTAPIHDGRQGVGEPGEMDWRNQDNEYRFKDAEVLNQLSADVFRTHQEFLRLAKQRLRE